jgi:hypothetical protein
MRALAAAALLLLAGCVHQSASPAFPVIAMERLSWGHAVASWSIDPAGTGRYTAPAPGGMLVTRSFAAGPAGYARLRRLLAGAEALRGPDPRCSKRIYDLEYGRITWTPPAGPPRQLNFDHGCPYIAAPHATRQIGRAADLVADWAANGPILESRKVENP